MPSYRARWIVTLGSLCRQFSRHLKTPLVVFAVLFVWLQLMAIGLRQPPGTTGPLEPASATPWDRSQQTYSDFLQQVTNISLLSNSTSAREFVNITDIWLDIQRSNAEQKVWNEDHFGPVSSDTVIIVIQVHKRQLYLETLIESLRNTRGIENTLLIFSHDVYDTGLNAVVQAIKFAKVLQIFYPFSTQIHPHSFPGQDPNDCPWDMKKAEASKIKCNNAEHPDLYGHYREAKYTQIKHHWWWKIIRVFDGLRVTRNHTGMVVFLEEDHYVVPDMLHMLNLLEDARKQYCAQCNVLSLGTYLKTVNFGTDSGRVEIWPWIASKHNMGMVLKRDIWKEIRSCAEKFCNFDDYNWDWSLQYISTTCMAHKLMVILPKAPRAFHIGECGVHHKDKNCSANQMLTKVRKLLTVAESHLFPSKLNVLRSNRRVGKTQKGNGGWGDVRDHWLCLHVLNTSTAQNT